MTHKLIWHLKQIHELSHKFDKEGKHDEAQVLRIAAGLLAKQDIRLSETIIESMNLSS